MNDDKSDESANLPSDDELAEMLANAEGGKRKKKKRNLTEPSPRLPEALYYYLFILVEATILIGVWGFMRMGLNEALKGPGFEDPIGDQVLFQIESIWVGFVETLAGQPWVPIGVAVVAGAVFLPKTPKARKRMATIVSSIVVCLFILMIALQFSEDIATAGAMG